MINLISELLQVHRNTYFNWRKENRPIIKLLEKSFNKSELEHFLKTGDVPFKIQFADKYFNALNEEFTNLLSNGKGVKALFTAILNDKSIDNVSSLNKAIIENYNNQKISFEDLSDYMDNPISEQLLLYILDNSKQDFRPYLSSLISQSSEWLVKFFHILKLSIEKNVFDKIFFTKIANSYAVLAALPFPSAIFSREIKQKENEKIFNKYNQILDDVLQALKNGSYNNLYVYNISDNYELMNFIPATSEWHKGNHTVGNANEYFPSLYEFEAYNSNSN